MYFESLRRSADKAEAQQLAMDASAATLQGQLCAERDQQQQSQPTDDLQHALLRLSTAAAGALASALEAEAFDARDEAGEVFDAAEGSPVCAMLADENAAQAPSTDDEEERLLRQIAIAHVSSAPSCDEQQQLSAAVAADDAADVPWHELSQPELLVSTPHDQEKQRPKFSAAGRYLRRLGEVLRELGEGLATSASHSPRPGASTPSSHARSAALLAF